MIAVAAFGEFIVGWKVADGTLLLKMKMGPKGDIMKHSRPTTIQALLLRDNLLVVAVAGLGYEAQQAKRRVLSAYAETKIFVFDMTSIGKDETKLELLANRQINGDFVSIRAIGDKVHFVMSNELNLYHFLSAPFWRHNNKNFSGLDGQAYLDEVRKIASNHSIPNFVQQVSEEIIECGFLPNLVRLNRWTTSDISNPSSSMQHFLYNAGYAQSLVTIVSFDLNDVRLGLTERLQCVSVAGSFFPAPSWDVSVYSATDTFVMAVEGYDYNPKRDKYLDSTYLVAFDLDGAAAFPKVLGEVEGYVLSQYSFRVDGSILELATTVRDQWMFLVPRRQEGQLQSQGGSIVNVPTTENWVITLNLEGENGKMKELNRLKLGKEGEVFTAVRFYDNKAYAVTFRRMDPFYVLDTADPLNLTIAGVLDNITGWSSYLEPMNSDNTVLLAIGQETNQDGQVTGISISVFDARDLDNVNLSARLPIESSTKIWSDSLGLRNKNAVRFNPETGRLIIPMVLYSNSGDDYFRGFRVYIVNFDSIVEEAECTVDLTSEYGPNHYSSRSLEPRSMIIKGSFMSTMESHVTMKDLDTCITDWELTISGVDD